MSISSPPMNSRIVTEKLPEKRGLPPIDGRRRAPSRAPLREELRQCLAHQPACEALAIALVHRTRPRRVGHQWRVEKRSRALRFRLLLLVRRSGVFKPAAIDESEHAPQLAALEPHAVRSANVDDDAGAAAEVHSIHDF